MSTPSHWGLDLSNIQFSEQAKVVTVWLTSSDYLLFEKGRDKVGEIYTTIDISNTVLDLFIKL